MLDTIHWTHWTQYTGHIGHNTLHAGQGRYLLVFSPIISQAAATVNTGAELFTVSTKEAATVFSEIRPRITVRNLSRFSVELDKRGLGPLYKEAATVFSEIRPSITVRNLSRFSVELDKRGLGPLYPSKKIDDLSLF